MERWVGFSWASLRGLGPHLKVKLRGEPGPSVWSIVVLKDLEWGRENVLFVVKYTRLYDRLRGNPHGF